MSIVALLIKVMQLIFGQANNPKIDNGLKMNGTNFLFLSFRS